MRVRAPRTLVLFFMNKVIVIFGLCLLFCPAVYAGQGATTTDSIHALEELVVVGNNQRTVIPSQELKGMNCNVSTA